MTIKFLTKNEVAQLTGKNRSYKAQIKALSQMGIDHIVRPDGRPMVPVDNVVSHKNKRAPEKPTVRLNLSFI